MLWFGPKAPCPNCGRNVRKPNSSSAYLCRHCGHPGPWATPDQVHEWQTSTDARQKYTRLLADVGNPSADLSTTLPALKSTAPLTGYTPDEIRQFADGAILALVRSILADSVLTREADQRLQSAIPALGLSWESFLAAHRDVVDPLIIASANGGILASLATHRLITKDTEAVHLECSASLMKEVALREFRAGYSGFSFPIGKTGIRYRIGGARGRSVEVGTRIVPADTGTLSLSSRRAVFLGSKKTIEMLYSKLVDLEVFTDGVRFHLSNRQTAPLFNCDNGEVVAAIIHAAMQKSA